MSIESIDMVEKRYKEFTESNDKVQALARFMSATRNAFYELAYTLSDEEKIRAMEFYQNEKGIVANLICSLSNDELKMAAIRRFGIVDKFYIQVILKTLNSYENKVTLVKEFDLYDYCGDLINLDVNSNNKKL